MAVVPTSGDKDERAKQMPRDARGAQAHNIR
mgnify:CR=1